MRDKRGQGLSTNAIILIILGVVVLVILIAGFTVGWKTLLPFLSTDNVDTIVKACATACATDSVYSYCSKQRELETEDETLKDVTCYYLSKKQTKYGIEECSSITCNNVILEECGENFVDKGKTKQVLDPETETSDTKTLLHDVCPSESSPVEPTEG